MRALLGIAVITIAASVIPVGVLATGVAAADDYAGMTYSDALSALRNASKRGVIASRTGDSASNEDCVVTGSEQAPWVKGADFSRVTDTVLLNLTCNARVATATRPGNSAASPEGRAAIATAKEQAQQKQQQAAAETKPKH